jgi:allantoin racemase
MAIRLKIILPINNDSLNRDTEQEVEPLRSSDFEFVVTNLDAGPTFIENRYDDYQAHSALIEAGTTAEQDGFAGIFVDCFTDTAVHILRELVDIPVVGGFAPALLTANLLAQRYSIITALPSVVPIYEQLATQLGVRHNVVSIRNIHTHIVDLQDRDQVVSSLTQEAMNAVEEGAQAVVLGCTGMLGVADELQQRLRSTNMDVPVINPTTAGLSMLKGLAEQKLTHSRIAYPKSLREEHRTP